jgi:hypothetical protein
VTGDQWANGQGSKENKRERKKVPSLLAEPVDACFVQYLARRLTCTFHHSCRPQDRAKCLVDSSVAGECLGHLGLEEN